MPTLFISDLHVVDDPYPVATLLSRWLASLERVDAVYILGDLFDAWIGDDLSLPEFPRLTGALRDLTHRGIPAYVMRGNRDFLLGDAFAQQTGCRLIDDPSVVDLYGTPTLLLHGDTLCTDDHAYQGYRTQVRTPEWQQRFLQLSDQERRQIAQRYRDESRRQNQTKANYLMDVNANAVAEAFLTHGVRHMIHGHTHRQAAHRVPLNEEHGMRYVLGDWQTQPNVLICDNQNWNFDIVR